MLSCLPICRLILDTGFYGRARRELDRAVVASWILTLRFCVFMLLGFDIDVGLRLDRDRGSELGLRGVRFHANSAMWTEFVCQNSGAGVQVDEVVELQERMYDARVEKVQVCNVKRDLTDRHFCINLVVHNRGGGLCRSSYGFRETPVYGRWLPMSLWQGLGWISQNSVSSLGIA